MDNIGYLIGVLLGDGDLDKHRSHYAIRLRTTNEKFALRFRKTIEKIVDKKAFIYRKNRQRIWNQGQKTYSFSFTEITIKLYSKLWFQRCELLKKQILEGIIPNDLNYIKGIIKGFYDSEGSYVEYHNNLHFISIYNKNKALLQTINEMLLRIGIKPSNIYSCKSKPWCSSLMIYRQPEVKTFINKIGVERK